MHVEKLRKLGIPAGLDDIVNTVVTMTRWLLANHPDAVVFPIAERPLIGALEQAGIQMSDDPSRIDIVIASYDRGFDYRKLQIAFDAIWYYKRARLVATNPDPYCPMDGGRGEPDRVRLAGVGFQLGPGASRLTVEWAGSVDVASSKYLHDRDEGGFPKDLYRAAGVEDLLDKYPQKLLDLGVVVGGLQKSVAGELGLRAGTPVALGGVDAHMGALGLGVVEPGKLALITGSSHVMIAQSADPSMALASGAPTRTR